MCIHVIKLNNEIKSENGSIKVKCNTKNYI